MTAEGFNEFVAARSTPLLRTAYLLTQDWALAEDLVQSSLVKTWSAWSRIEGDPEAYVRRILVNTHASWWRRRWRSEVPSDVLPEPPHRSGPGPHRPAGTSRGSPSTPTVPRVIAAAAVGTRNRSVSVTFVPTSLDLGVFTRCAGNGAYTVTINGREFTSGTGCGLAYVKTAQPLSKAYGVTVGQPATATFSARDGPVDSLAIAIGQSVDPADYPTPPHPATLAPLEHPGESRRMAYLTAEDYYAGEWGLAAEYGKESFGLDLKKGQAVRLTVTPARMTGDWYLHVQHTGEQTTD